MKTPEQKWEDEGRRQKLIQARKIVQEILDEYDARPDKHLSLDKHEDRMILMLSRVESDLKWPIMALEEDDAAGS